MQGFLCTVKKMLKIGPLTIDSNVLLAPMSGVSDLPFRRLVKRLGAGLVISEMIASQAMIRQTRQTMRMIQKSDLEKPSVVQLAGCEPFVMAEAAKLNQDMGADIIDINMGCPVKKVVNGWAGSALMKDELLAARIIEATVKAVQVPVTLKMRTGWDDGSRNAPKLAKIAEDLGVQMITIHGRTRCQLYNGRADWHFIQQVKDVVSVPLIANGDIVSVEDARQCLAISGADGVMIGRGTYGRPWFIHQVHQALHHDQHLDDPTIFEKYKIMVEHFEDILHHYGMEGGLLVARKHIGWYSKGLPSSAEFRAAVNNVADRHAVLELMKGYFEPLLQEEAA